MIQVNEVIMKNEYEIFSRKSLNGLPFKNFKFSIMHGNGNVILVLDEKLSCLTFREINSTLAKEICESFNSIKIDGIAFLRSSSENVKMTFFDRDGTTEPMCGNGLRCLALYSHYQGYISEEAFILTDDGEKWVSVVNGLVKVALGRGREFKQISDNQYFVFTSVPHVIVFVDDLYSINVKEQGAALRYNEYLCKFVNHPEGVHVNFLKKELGVIRIRTYEVGVEDETLSCGSGVAASAFIANKISNYSFPLRVTTNCGEMVVNESEHGLVISGTVEYLFSNIVNV